MTKLTVGDFEYLAQCLEGFLFGVYTAIFAMYWHYHTSKDRTPRDNTTPITFYALCVLYVLSVAIFALDTAAEWFMAFSDDIILRFRLDGVIQPVVFGCYDFIAQFILIHRCWVVWGSNIRVVLVPSFLAFTYLVMWTTAIGAQYLNQDKIQVVAITLSLTGLIASMTVNALSTGLIVFKIFKVFRAVNDTDTTSDEKSFGLTGGRTLRSIIFIIIESGMALFAIQFTRVVLAAIVSFSTNANADAAYSFVTSIHEMLNGIAPTLILVRVSMGLSFRDEPSLVDAVSGLQFNAINDPNQTSGTEIMSQDGSFPVWLDDPKGDLEMVNINQERGDGDIGRCDDTPHRNELYKQSPPPFGHALLKHYALDPGCINLNNGSYGTTPGPVLEAIDELTLEIESNPDLFHQLLYKERLVGVRQKLARLIGAKTDEVVLVSNASMGINTILRNFEWEKGDQIFVFSTTYNSISRTVANLSDIPPFPSVSTILLNFPTTHSKIIQEFKSHLHAHPASPNKKRVVVIDSIISNPGILLPWKEMVQICKDEDVWSVIDAAHSIGQEVDLDLEKIAPDFWVSNCHKWLSGKRSCAVLYVPERNQHVIKTSIPTSHAYISPVDRKTPNFVEQFEWNGTIDWAPFLTVADSLEFRQWLGGEHKINAYCHNLALEGGKLLAELWGTSLMDPTGEFTLNMVNVELPIRSNPDKNVEIHEKLEEKLLERNAYSPPFYHNGAWWTRCSAQVWNELDDFDEIGKIWLEVVAEVVKELDLEKF